MPGGARSREAGALLQLEEAPALATTALLAGATRTNPFRRDEALGGANICLIQVLQSAAGYLGFSDLDAELDTIFEGIKASFQKEPDAGDAASV